MFQISSNKVLQNSDAMNSNIPAIEMINICKAFAAVKASDMVNLKVYPGTIHGIIGENGAGKSTAMKILYGLYKEDTGSLKINGKVCHWHGPRDAIAAGIGMVHQHFMLGRPYTALDNIILGAEPSFNAQGFIPSIIKPINRAKARKVLQELCNKSGLQVDLDASIESLPVGVQQRIEILKLLYRDAKILILDEPTAVLTPQEVIELFQTLRKLRDQGKTILIITHKLKEVMHLTSRVTVFRAGKVTGEVNTSDTDEEGLAELMVGRKVVLRVEAPGICTSPEAGKPVCELEKVSLYNSQSGGKDRPKLNKLNFQVKRGEILGIAGVEGNGQSELLQLICSPSSYFNKHGSKINAVGNLKILEKNANGWDTAEVKNAKVGVIPEDRQREGLLMESSLDENFLLGFQRTKLFSKWGFILRNKVLELTAKYCKEYDVRPSVLNNWASKLSGGNQQKLIIAREFFRDPQFLIAAHPTRGVDVGAIEFIHNRIVAARNNGVGVLLVSSELEEVMSLSDRILVMYEGEIVAEFLRGTCDESTLGIYMGGGAKQEKKLEGKV